MPTKWYFKTYVLVIAFLSLGPFALPLVWFNPRFNRAAKIAVTLIVLAASYCLGMVFVKAVASLVRYYRTVFEGGAGL